MRRRGLAILIVFCSFHGCASDPPPRLEAYLGPISQPAEPRPQASAARLAEGVESGLVVINDTTAPGSAPALSGEVLDELVRVLRGRLERAIPAVKVAKVLRPAGMTPDGDPRPFTEMAKKEGLERILLAIFSSTEMESPAYLPLGGIRGGAGGMDARPGYEVRNFARLELALLDGKSGQIILRTDGQAYATLYRLDISLKTNTYPVVYRDQLTAPIFPQESVAYDVLRGVSSDDAIKQALMHFKIDWDRKFPS